MLDNAPDAVRRVVDGFMAETRSELWSSENEMIDHYREDSAYRKLRAGEVGGNLIYKYKSMSLALTMPDWIDFLADQLKELAHQRPEMETEINALAEFSRNRTWKFLDESSSEETISMSSSYDFIVWLDGPEGAPLAGCASENPIEYIFDFTEDQKRSRNDAFRRYGTDVNGLSKIVTRLVLQSLFRKVREQGKSSDSADGTVRNSNTRYALAH